MNTRRAFTLVEILTVIVIISILVALVTLAVAGAMRSAKRARIGVEMSQIVAALELYKGEFGEYPPDMFDDEALVRHVKKRWPRLDWANLENLPIANFNQHGHNPLSSLTGLEREAWLIRNAVSIAYGPVRYRKDSQLYDVDYNDWLYKNISMHLPEVLYSKQGTLTLWLGGFPNVDGKLSGFFADPENPFTRTNAFDGKNFLNLEIGENKRARFVVFEIWDVRYSYTDPITQEVTWIPETLKYTYAIPILGNEVGGDFVSYAYYKGRTDGGDGAYKVGGTIKTIAGPYARSLNSWGAPYAESRSGAGIKWCNPTTYQLIHPGLDGKFGDRDIAERFIGTGEGIGPQDLDNLTNFSDYKELKSILP